MSGELRELWLALLGIVRQAVAVSLGQVTDPAAWRVLRELYTLAAAVEAQLREVRS